MRDLDTLIEDLEAINRRVGFTFTAVVDAIKVVKMWKKFKTQGIKDYYRMNSSLCVDEVVEQIEEEFFPSIIHQTVKVAIQGANKQRLRNTIETIECVEGVNEVRQ